MTANSKEWAYRVAEALADTLVAYLTVQARQGLSAAYSEYLLYDPIVRVAKHRRWDIRAEWPVPKQEHKKGDNPRIDFRIRNPDGSETIYIEIKYFKKFTKFINVQNDFSKLERQMTLDETCHTALILVVGKIPQRHDAKRDGIATKPVLNRHMYGVNFRGGITNFGAAVYRVTKKGTKNGPGGVKVHRPKKGPTE